MKAGPSLSFPLSFFSLLSLPSVCVEGAPPSPLSRPLIPYFQLLMESADLQNRLNKGVIAKFVQRKELAPDGAGGVV